MSREAIEENGAVLESGEYWSRVNRSTFFGGLMRRASEASYQETLRETGNRASDMVEEIYEDLQQHKKRLSSIDSGGRNALAKQVQGLYDVCRMADTSCLHSRECISMLNLSGFFSNPFSDERAIETALRKIKNNPDFFASECIDLIEKAADWGIAFAAGSSEKKRAFLEDVAQGKGKDFFQEVADAYQELEENIRNAPDAYAVSGTMEMNFQQTGDRDLYLGIGKCAIKYTCQRLDFSVIINFKIEDKYNFDEIRTFRENNDKIVKFNFGIGALANDAGLLSLADEVISKYDIYITFQKTVITKGA